MTILNKREWVKTNSSVISLLQRFTDVVSIYGGLWFVCYSGGIAFFYSPLLMVLVTLVIFQMIGGMTDFWRTWRGVKISTELLLLWQNWTMSLVFSAGVMAFTALFSSVFPLWFAWYLLSGLTMILFRLLIRAVAGWLRRRGFNTRVVAIVGDLPDGLVLANSFRDQPWLGFHVAGRYDDPARCPGCGECDGDLEQLVTEARAGRIQNIYIALPVSEQERIGKLVRELSDTTCSVMLIPDVFAFGLLHTRADEIN